MRVLEGEMGDDQDVGKAVRVEVERKAEKRDRKAKEKDEKERRLKEGEEALRAAIKVSTSGRRRVAFGARVTTNFVIFVHAQVSGAVLPKGASKKLFEKCPIDVTPPHFDPDALPPDSLPELPLLPMTSADVTLDLQWKAPPTDTPLIYPVFLLLPLASPPTRDLCLEFHTHASFGQVLESMEHDPAQYQCYIATVQGRVLKVGAKLLLGKVLEAAAKVKEGEKVDGWELKEGWALEMVAVPKGAEGEKWIASWKDEVKKGVGALL